MKKGIFITLIILSIIFGFTNKALSQHKFQIDYTTSGTMDMDIFANVKSITNGYAMAGFVDGASYIFGDFPSVLIAIDTGGAITLARQFQDGSVIPTTPLLVNDLQTTSSSGYVMTGSYGSYAMLLKVNSSGSTVFAKKYGLSPNEYGNIVKETSTGPYIVAGTTSGKSMNPDKDSLSIYVFKTDASGNYSWGRSYTLTSAPVFDSQDAANDVVEVSDGYVFAGYNSQKNGTDTTTNILVFKTDFNGTLQWMKTYGDLAYNEEAYSIKHLSNGNLLVAGYTDRTSSGLDAGDIAVLELDGSGNLVHSYSYNVGYTDEAGSIQQTSSGGYDIVGWTITNMMPLTIKSFLLNLNSSYATVFAKEYNSMIGGFFAKGEQTPDGGYVIGSMVGTTSYQFHMIKTDVNGNSGCNETSVTPSQNTYVPTVASITPTVHSGGSGSNYTVSNTSISPTKTIDCISMPLTANAGNDQAVCSGSSTSIGGSPTANGGTAPYTYAWSPSAGLNATNIANPTASPTIATTYTVTVTDNVSATATDAVVVSVNPLPTAFNITGSGNYCAGGTGVVIGLSGSQNGVNYQLQVNSVNTGTPVAGTGNAISFGNQTAAGTYTVIATNTTTGCTNTMTGSATITVNPLPTAYNLTGGGSYCSGGGGTVVGLSGSDVGVNYQLQINSVNTGSPVAGTGNAISFGNQTAAGTYTVIATNTTTGCTNTMTGSATITVNPLPTAYNLTGGGSYCSGGSGAIVGLSGSDVGVSYQLQVNSSNIGSPVAGTGNAISFGNQISAGTYTVIATNTTTGCTNTMTGNAIITINPLPNPNLGPDVGTCISHSVNLNASGGTIYAWSPASGLSCTNCANPVASPADTTTYTVTVTDANGCSNTDDITVFIYNIPPANAGSDVVICKGSSANLLATGGVIYAWSPASGLSSTTVANPIANPTTTTTYVVTVTDAAGCSATDNVMVSVNPLPNADAGNNVTICQAASTTLNASGGVSYVWSPSSTLSNDSIYNPIASPTSTTTYTVTVTDSNGCSNTDNVTITVNNPTANAGTDAHICRGSSTTLSATGGTSYSWSPSTGLSNSTIFNPVANPTSTIIYTVTATNASGCTASDAVVVTVNPVPNADAGNDVSICKGSSTTLSASGGSAYQWGPVSGLSNPNIYDPMANPTTTTTYTVTVTDVNGCTNSDKATVNVLATPMANAGPDVAVCFGESAILNATGGGSYLWNTGDTTATVTFIPSVTTTYIVTVSYMNGCSSSDEAVVTVNAFPTINLTVDPSNYCYVGQIITFTALPSTYSNYTFYVNNSIVQSGSSNIYVTNSLLKHHKVSVMATSNGCDSPIDSIDIEVKSIPNAFIPGGDDVANSKFVPGLDLTIINRWGQKLYEGTDGWNGMYNGKFVSPGTYFYIIKLSDLKNVITELKGSVTVIKKSE